MIIIKEFRRNSFLDPQDVSAAKERPHNCVVFDETDTENRGVAGIASL